MAKIAEIKLANAELAQLISFFLERIDKIRQDNSYYTDFFDDHIDHPTLSDKIFSIGYFGWGIYMNNQKYVGRIKHYQNLAISILTFECEEEDPQSILAFAKFLQMQLTDSGFTVTDFRDLTEVQVTTPEVDNSIYTPKTKRAREKWKLVYSVIEDMRKEAKEEYYIPTSGDYRDRVENELSIGYSTKTILRIIEAGDKGQLA